jgi:hypothetical protein
MFGILCSRICDVHVPEKKKKKVNSGEDYVMKDMKKEKYCKEKIKMLLLPYSSSFFIVFFIYKENIYFVRK